MLHSRSCANLYKHQFLFCTPSSRFYMIPCQKAIEEAMVAQTKAYLRHLLSLKRRSPGQHNKWANGKVSTSVADSYQKCRDHHFCIFWASRCGDCALMIILPNVQNDCSHLAGMQTKETCCSLRICSIPFTFSSIQPESVLLICPSTSVRLDGWCQWTCLRF